MERHCIICAWDCWGNGGVETYFLRIFQWAKENEYGSGLLVPKENDISNFLSKFEQLHVNILYYTSRINSIKLDSKSKNWLLGFDTCTAISASIHSYIAVEKLKLYCDLKECNNFLYILHPSLSRISECKLINKPYLSLIKQFSSNDIIFMDEETLESFLSYYNIEKDVERYYSNIQRLGINVDCAETITEDTCKGEKNILTITRMEFPFKGYVKGLVDCFVELNKIYNNISLTIIGDGRDYSVIKEYVESKDEKVKNKIILTGFVDYSKIDEYAQQAYIYVGMGTTLIDVGKYGTPGVVAASYQWEDYSPGIFIKDTLAIDGMIGTASWNKTSFLKEIDKILKMSDDEYINLKNETQKGIISNFNIDRVMKSFVSIKSSDIHIDKMLYIYDFLISVLKKKKRRNTLCK